MRQSQCPLPDSCQGVLQRAQGTGETSRCRLSSRLSQHTGRPGDRLQQLAAGCSVLQQRAHLPVSRALNWVLFDGDGRHHGDCGGGNGSGSDGRMQH